MHPSPKGIGADAEAYRCPLLGGDTDRTPGLLSVSISAFGSLPHGTMVKRSGARAGDRIVVTGTVGDAALGLVLRAEPERAGRAKLGASERAYLAARYLLPEPKVALAAALRAHARAAIDISDGLAGDLMKLAAASGVSARIEAARLPLSPAAQKMLTAEPALLETVLTGGDDYEILAAVSPAALSALQNAAKAAGIALSEIGTVGEGAGVEIVGLDNRPIDAIASLLQPLLRLEYRGKSPPGALRRQPVFGKVRAASGGVAARFHKENDRVGFMTATTTALWVIIACGALALVYGVWAIRSVLSADAGNARMQEIAAAIREGAQAYLRRQYTTIGMVGIVMFIVVGYFLGWPVADGLRRRRDPFGRDRLHRHERLGARQRAHGAGGDQVARGRA